MEGLTVKRAKREHQIDSPISLSSMSGRAASKPTHGPLRLRAIRASISQALVSELPVEARDYAIPLLRFRHN